MNSNPYAQPGQQKPIDEEFASRYRIDQSKVTLKEFQDISGKFFLGAAYWLLLKIGLVRASRQVIDGPKPFLDDTCHLDDVPEPIRSHLLDGSQIAQDLGFFEPRVCASISTGTEVNGGAIRMLHESRDMFLQIIASSQGSVVLDELIIMSVVSGHEGIEAYGTTNGRPKFKRPRSVHIQRFIGADLQRLVKEHRSWLDLLAKPKLGFSNYDDVASVMDRLSELFFSTQIERGIFVPEP